MVGTVDIIEEAKLNMKNFFAKFGISSVLGLLILSSTLGWAQNKETIHQQDFTPGSQVHAQGKSNDNDGLSFTQRYAHPKAISSYGERIDWLFQYTSWVTFIFFMIMAIALVYFIFAYRERPGHKAYYTHGLSKGNMWTTRALDAAVFVTLDLVLIFSSFVFSKDFLWKFPPKDKDPVRVQVMPQQWYWNFRYAGTDAKFGTPDDIVMNHLMRMPKDRPVVVEMKSRDVIHGFMIPAVRLQMDAIPGDVTKFWFDSNTAGDFELACYHLCGSAHYKMKGFVKVMEDSDFRKWEVDASKLAEAQYDPDDKQLQWGWPWSTL
jgi:cytochrome c oxidase subunit 2